MTSYCKLGKFEELMDSQIHMLVGSGKYRLKLKMHILESDSYGWY